MPSVQVMRSVPTSSGPSVDHAIDAVRGPVAISSPAGRVPGTCPADGRIFQVSEVSKGGDQIGALRSERDGLNAEVGNRE